MNQISLVNAPSSEFSRHQMTRIKTGHRTLTAEIDGKTVTLIVDTGASNTILDVAWCQSHGIPLVETPHRGGGAGGVGLPIYALGSQTILLDGVTLGVVKVMAVDMSHVNQGLIANGAEPVEGVLGGDALSLHDAVIDYKSEALCLRHLAKSRTS